MQATFKIYRVSHDSERDVLILAGKVVKGTARAGMKASLELEIHAITEVEIVDIEMVDADGICLLALVLPMSGREAAGFLEHRGLVGESILLAESDQERKPSLQPSWP